MSTNDGINNRWTQVEDLYKKMMNANNSASYYSDKAYEDSDYDLGQMKFVNPNQLWLDEASQARHEYYEYQRQLKKLVNEGLLPVAKSKLSSCKDKIAKYKCAEEEAIAERKKEIERRKREQGCNLSAWEYEKKSKKLQRRASWMLALIIITLGGLAETIGLWIVDIEFAACVCGVGIIAIVTAIILMQKFKKSAARCIEKVQLIDRIEKEPYGAKTYAWEISQLEEEKEKLEFIILCATSKYI